MGCISGLSKYILFIFNFLISLCGLILIILGAISVANQNRAITELNLYSIDSFAIGIGVVIFIIAFLGCCGAIKENSCMLLTYAIILIILLIIQVVLGILAFVAIKNSDGGFEQTIEDKLKELIAKQDEESIKLINEFQQGFECCGIDGPSDYTIVPASCCENNVNPCRNPYKTGCVEAISDKISDSFKWIGGIAVGFVAVELVGAIFAFIVRYRGR